MPNTPYQTNMINALRRCYDGAIAAGDRPEANQIYAKIAVLSQALMPICPRCRHTALCNCLSSVVQPKRGEVIGI